LSTNLKLTPESGTFADLKPGFGSLQKPGRPGGCQLTRFLEPTKDCAVFSPIITGEYRWSNLGFLMSASDSLNFGFLMVSDLGGDLLIGGYLVLNAVGRPREFHCTEPVKPNRAQQILYGATLRPYLYGEQIGKALVESGKMFPNLIVTNSRHSLALGDLLEIPVVWLPGCDESGDVSELSAGLIRLTLGDVDVWLDERHKVDADSIRSQVLNRRAHWDFQEPFERISDAISELQKAA